MLRMLLIAFLLLVVMVIVDGTVVRVRSDTKIAHPGRASLSGTEQPA